MIVLVPSRGRPQSLARLIRACKTTKASADFRVRLDEDDPCVPCYQRISLPDNWILKIGSRVRPAGAMRELFAVERVADTYFLLGDDTIPRTDYWDIELETSALQTGISYPDDGIHGASKVTHPVVSGGLLRAMGFWTLPGLTHLYVDTVLEYIGQQLNCLTYRGDVLLDHLHFSTGKSPFDDTYRRVDNGADAACYKNWIASTDTRSLLARLKSIVPLIDAGFVTRCLPPSPTLASRL